MQDITNPLSKIQSAGPRNSVTPLRFWSFCFEMKGRIRPSISKQNDQKRNGVIHSDPSVTWTSRNNICLFVLDDHTVINLNSLRYGRYLTIRTLTDNGGESHDSMPIDLDDVLKKVKHQKSSFLNLLL